MWLLTSEIFSKILLVLLVFRLGHGYRGAMLQDRALGVDAVQDNFLVFRYKLLLSSLGWGGYGRFLLDGMVLGNFFIYRGDVLRRLMLVERSDCREPFLLEQCGVNLGHGARPGPLTNRRELCRRLGSLILLGRRFVDSGSLPVSHCLPLKSVVIFHLGVARFISIPSEAKTSLLSR